MPRMRTLKPGFFTNEHLCELEPLARLLFAGLWCWADREGRLEDRPKRIKIEVLPCDDCDVDTLLDQLAAAGFIERYAVEGKPLIQVVNFRRHQNPHVKEAASTIPAPCSHRADTVLAPDQNGASPAGHESWGESHESWGEGSGERGPDPAAPGAAARAGARGDQQGRSKGARPAGRKNTAIEPGKPRGWHPTWTPGQRIDAPSPFDLTAVGA